MQFKGNIVNDQPPLETPSPSVKSEPEPHPLETSISDFAVPATNNLLANVPEECDPTLTETGILDLALSNNAQSITFDQIWTVLDSGDVVVIEGIGDEQRIAALEWSVFMGLDRDNRELMSIGREEIESVLAAGKAVVILPILFNAEPDNEPIDEPLTFPQPGAQSEDLTPTPARSESNSRKRPGGGPMKPTEN